MAVLDGYLQLWNSDYGWKKTAEDPSAPRLKKETIYKWVNKPELLRLLKNDNVPTLTGFLSTCPRRERANFITMWYRVALLKCYPEMYLATMNELTQEKLDCGTLTINPYDAVHSFALNGRPPIDSHWGPSACDKPDPEEGMAGKDVAGGTQKVDTTKQVEENKRYYFGPRELARNRIHASRKTPMKLYMTEDVLCRVIGKIGCGVIDVDYIVAPMPADSVQVQALLDTLVGIEFRFNGVILEPESMTRDGDEKSLTRRMALTALVNASENATAFHEHSEETARDEGELKVQESDDGMKNVKSMKQATAASMASPDACEYADIPLAKEKPILDPVSDVVRRAVSQPWQPSAIVYLMRQLYSPLRGGILSDACGLGKTLTSLALIYFSTGRAVQRNETANEDPDSYQASLIVTPARVLLQWVDQIEKCSGSYFNVRIFWGDPDHISDPIRKERTVKTLADIHAKLDALDPTDTKTANTIVITSYDTMRMRVCQEGCWDRSLSLEGHIAERLGGFV